MERLPKIAAAGPVADYSVGQRVMTREGIAGVIEDVLEGPADLTTYWVKLDAGLGGGEYAEGEIWPESSSTASIVEAGVEHTAADDYPELGTILSDRLPPALRTVAALDDAAQRIAITFEPKPPSETADPEPEDPEEQRGYKDGLEDGKAGVTRNFQEPTSPAYRAGYDRGWAFGVQTNRQPVDTFGGDTFGDDLEEAQVAGIDPITSGFIMDFIRADDSDSKYDGYRSTDWCRYRRDNHCFYSKNLNVEASKQAGYAVWIPEDRGTCPRKAWTAQQACPMALPGKNVPGGYTDATVPWEQGGQHGGTPTETYRQSSLDPTLAFHITASWRTVQEKAKRIRSGGGVRVVASKHGTVVGHVRGDTNVYESEIVRVPGRRSIGKWACGCKWGSYSWGRSGPWKKFEGRMCSHVLALQYEAQARGMFDREMTLDEKQPEWMDKGTHVRTPGSYDRDKGRYSSLNAPLAAYRPVDEQDDAARPLTALVAAMQAEGARYAEVRQFVQSLGVEDVPGIVREARSTKGFMAKVHDMIRSLFINEQGQIVDEDTNERVAAKDVLFPNWDPVKGITDYHPTHTASGGCGCGGSCGCGDMSRTASPADLIGQTRSLDDAADALLNVARVEEPGVTRDITSMALQTGGRFAGLEHRFKGKGSLLRKMRDEEKDHGTPAATAMAMSDALRFTLVFPPEHYTEDTKAVIEGLKRKGYGTRVKNYWLRGDAYNGVNVALTTPDGFPVELQFHTDQSLRTKEKIVHPMYEEWRDKDTTPFRKAQLGFAMRDAYDMVHRPANALAITDRKKQPTTPWNKVDWMHGQVAASVDPWRYLLLDSGRVLRWHDGSVEVWRDGMWEEDAEFGRYPFLGEPRAEEIGVDAANAYLTGEPTYDGDNFEFVPSQVQVRGSFVDDDEDDFLPYAYVTIGHIGETVIEARENGWPVGHITWSRDTGAIVDVDVDKNLADSEIPGELLRRAKEIDPRVHQPMAHAAVLDDDPEAALPVTYGDDEPEEREIDAISHKDAALLVAQMDAFIAGTSEVNPFAHLGDPRSGGGSGDTEVMRAAQQALAKEALKTYSPAEKKQIIDEGLDVEASNLDRLDIKGTHYEALEASLGKAASLAVADDMWLMSGDPND